MAPNEIQEQRALSPGAGEKGLNSNQWGEALKLVRRPGSVPAEMRAHFP